jgi:glycosyltransferase involved in cell wall biosynthesis
MRKMTSRIHPSIRPYRIPEIATMIILGRRMEVIDGTPHIAGPSGEMQPVHMLDFYQASGIASSVRKCFDGPIDVSNVQQVMMAHSKCVFCFQNSQDWIPKKTVAMLSAGFGCGAWRMEFPAAVAADNESSIDILESKTKYVPVDEYDVIRFHWLHDFVSYGKLCELKSKGKRLVADVDDDLFSIPEHNPASKAFDISSRAAYLKMLAIADCITVSNDVVADRIRQRLIEATGSSPEICTIPNTIDTRHGWREPGACFSMDGTIRLFWSGSNTHSVDWMVISDAIDRIFKERSDINLVIWGDIPKGIDEKYGDLEHWQGRIEYAPGTSPSEYFMRLANHVVADIGLAPLKQDHFNEAKSNIKFIEYSLAGMPTIASNTGPFAYTISDKFDGILVPDSSDEWYDSIMMLVNSPEYRFKLASNARSLVSAEYDISTYKVAWKKAIFGD